MKKLTRTLLNWRGFVCAIVAALAFEGCKTLDPIANATTTPQYSYLPVTNTVVEPRVEPVTNTFAEVKPGAEPGSTVTNFVPQVVFITNDVPVTRVEIVTNTVYATNPAIERGLQIAQAATPFIPAPFGTAAQAALGALAGVFGLLAAYKNKQANNLNTQLSAVVHGVEQATSAIDPAAGDKVKSTIATVSKIAGVAADLDKTVQKLTN